VSVPPVNARALAFGGLIAMATAVGIGRFIYTPILPPMVEGLGLTKGQAGLIASANFVGYLVGALAAAAVPINAPRRWLVGGLAVSALTTGAMSWPHAILPFLTLRFLGGVASAFVLVLASTVVLERLAASGRSDAAAIHFSGVGAGIALSSLLTWGLQASDLGWRAMWLGGGILSLIGTLLAIVLIPSSSPAQSQVRPTPTAASKRGLSALAAAYGLVGFGYVITATFIVAIVRASADVRTAEPMVWLVLGLSAIPSVAAWIAVGRHFGVLQAFAAACLVEAAGIALSVVWPTLTGLFLSAALLGGTFMGLTALGLMASQALSANRRRTFALMTSAFGLGQIVGPLVAGYGFDMTGSFFLPSMIAAAGLVVGAGLSMSIVREI
jgi:predicted MFS family arabinose efflux permease